jgi:hypothetical protein
MDTKFKILYSFIKEKKFITTCLLLIIINEISSADNYTDFTGIEADEFIKTVKVQGNYAFTGVGQKLVTLNISSSVSPIEVGSLEFSEGKVEDIKLTESKAYIAAGGSGFHIVDISNPYNLKEIGFVNTPGYAEGVAVSGKYAYVADGAAGLRILDLSDPVTPNEIGFVNIPGYAFDVKVSGNYAYLACAGGGLRVVDISNPLHPSDTGGYDTPGYAYGLTIVGNSAFIADGWGGFRIIDVSNPKNPREIGFYKTPGWAFDVDVIGNQAYVADASAGVRIIDISNQNSPVEIGAYDQGLNAHDVAVIDDLLYVADLKVGLRIFQLSASRHFTPLGFCKLGNVAEIEIRNSINTKSKFNSQTKNLKPEAYENQLEKLSPEHLSDEEIINMSAQTELKPVGQVGGSIQTVAVRGDYAYAGIGLRMEVLDVSDPTNLQQVSSSTMLGGFITDISLSGSYAYVIVGGKGLWVIDISDPIHPNELGFLNSTGFAEGVAVESNYVYLASGGAGLRVIDVTIPANPKEISYVYTQGYAFDVQVADNIAYIACAGAGICIVDVSDPAHPKEVGGYDTPGYAYSVAVVGSTVYVADGWKGLRVIDVFDPTHPKEIGADEEPVKAMYVTLSGTIAYLADASSGLRIVDVSNPIELKELGFYKVSGGNVSDVAVSQSTAYLVDRNWGLRVVDVSDPASLTQTGFYCPMGYVEAVAVQGDYAYVAAGYSLRVVDISDPVHPNAVGIYDTQGGLVSDVVVYDTIAYVSTLKGSYDLHILDISDPPHPKMIGGIPGVADGAYREIVLAGQIVYVADELGLRLISVDDPTSPHQISFINLIDNGQPTIGVAVSGTVACLAGSYGGVAIVDVSDPVNPELVGSCDTPGTTQGVAIAGNRVYAADSQSGLRIIDISNAGMPTEMGFFDTPGCAMSVTVSDTIAYVSDGGGGIQIVNVFKPFTPTLISAYDTPGWATDMTLAGDFVYVADRLGGLLILEKTTNQITSKSDISGTCLVTSLAESGTGTLRRCIENAQAGEIITFDPNIFPPANAVSINLSSALPTLSQGHLTIDGSNAGVILDGSNTPEGTFGLLVASDSNKIMGLQILHFPANGIWVQENADFNIIGGDNTIGKGPTGEGNVISANGNDGGLHISGSGNIVQGNFIGTDATGTKSIANAHAGIQLAGPGNLIGGIVVGQRNIISGNINKDYQCYGLWLHTNAVNNTVTGNFIGTDATGLIALGNGAGIGMNFGASNNKVGGNSPEERNIISGNQNQGISLGNDGVTGNVISGNFIGTDVTGAKAMGNSRGVSFEDGPFNNVLGGTDSNEGNIISGNTTDGVLLSDAANNSVIGNFIGTNSSGTGALGNHYNGISIWNTNFSRIGGTLSGERNIISANGCGISIGGSSQDNIVLGNYIGTDFNGTRSLSLGWGIGVSINEGTRHNFVGGTTDGERNVISGTSLGVQITDAGIEYNWIAGNYIGTDATGSMAIGNQFGVQVENASNNFIGPGNIIANSGQSGVMVKGSLAIGNTITRNSITNNIGSGIELMEGGNSELSKPSITNVTSTSLSGTAPPNCNIEIFSDPESEGKVYEGTTVSDSQGAFRFTKSGGAFGINLTATATDDAGNSSEFSASVPVVGIEDLFIPLTCELYQNYPNPFSISSTISYSVPSSGTVILNVFDILGREVLTLVNEEMIPGKYQVKFNRSKIPGGVYFYKMQFGNSVITKKMLLCN